MLVSFDDLLNLPQVHVVDAILTETEITLQVEHTQHFAICHKCGERATEFFRNGEKLVLRYDTQAHCTTAFAEFLLLELVNSTVSDVVSKHQVSYDILQGRAERT